MPIVTITLSEQLGSAFIRSTADSVHQALVASGFPENDRFQRVFALSPDHFLYDSTYPNLSSPRSHQFLLIEILFSAPRSVAFKEEVLHQITQRLSCDLGLRAEDIMIVFTEAGYENVAITGDAKLHRALA